MDDVKLLESGIGPFLDTLWYTVVVKIGIPWVRKFYVWWLSHDEAILDRMLQYSILITRSERNLLVTMLKSLYEITIVMQGPVALRVISFLTVRFIYDNYLTLGFGFCPEIGFIKRFWKTKISIINCWITGFSSLCAISVFHFLVPNLAPGAKGFAGPFSMGHSGDHLLGLSFFAEFVSSFFYYAGFIAAFRCYDTKNTCLLKLILGLAGIYLVQDFTFDSLSSGVTREPLKCISAAVSSAFENHDPSILVLNGLVHSFGLFMSGWVFGQKDTPTAMTPPVVEDSSSSRPAREPPIEVELEEVPTYKKNK